MNNSKAIVFFIAFLILFYAAIVRGQTGGDFTITQSVIATGGGQQSAGGTFSLDGTIGQSIAGNAASGSPFSLTSGFWNFDALAPTAATVNISGRVKTESGKGIRNVALTLISATGEIFYARSGFSGGYLFEDVPSGQSYVLTVSARRYLFVQNPRFIMLLEELTNVDFVGTEQF